MPRRIFHIDLDAFFVSVERALDPSLCGRPVIVGGEPDGRGVVACASYEARPYGVRAGMPLAQARRLCPHALFLRGHFDHYKDVSDRFMVILAEYTPFLEPLGLDEAYMDMTGFESLYGPLAGVAANIRQRIRQELDITASVGIASCKVVAKVASDACKPDGLLEVPLGGDAAFLAPLPIERLPGAGHKTAPRLRSLGITTIGELAEASPAVLHAAFGAWGDVLRRSANGEGTSAVMAPEAPKSISRETTFPRDTLDMAFLRGTLRYLAERVAADLREERKLARCVTLKLRWEDFTTMTRHHTLKRPADSDEAVYGAGQGLLAVEMRKEGKGRRRRVRLIGIGVAELVEASPQLPLGLTEAVPHRKDAWNRDRHLASALDAIREKYGYTSVQKGLTLALRRTFPEERGRYLLKTACLSR